MCRQHLLGEHFEIHKAVGCVNKKRSLKGYIKSGFLEFSTLRVRHDELAREMKRRGMNHKSPLPEFNCKMEGRVDVDKSVRELLQRCSRCRERFDKYKTILETSGEVNFNAEIVTASLKPTSQVLSQEN